MGRKLGDYIHLRYQNYLKYGISTKNENEEANFHEIFDQHRTILRNAVSGKARSDASLKNLENQLNFFYGDSTSQSKQLENWGIDEATADEVMNTIIDIAVQAIDQLSSSNQVNWNDLSTDSINNAIEKRFAPLKKSEFTVRKMGGWRQGSWEAIGRRLIELGALYNKLSTSNNQSLVDRRFITQFQNFQRQYHMLINNFQEVDPTFQFRGAQEIDKRQNFIDELNDLIRSGRNSFVQQIHGELGEYMPLIITKVVSAYQDKVTTEVVSKVLKEVRDSMAASRTKSQKGLMLDNTIIRQLQNAGNFNQLTQVAGMNLRLNNTYDKVDIILDLPGEEPLNVSAKNYDLSTAQTKGIHLLSGTGIAKYIQDFPIFANHYLNLTVAHEDDSPSHSDLLAAHQMMYLTIAVSSLIGLSQGVRGDQKVNLEQAEALIVNERADGKGRFRVYSMKNILEKLFQFPQYIYIKGWEATTPHRPWWNQKYKPDAANRWSAAYGRVANIIAQLESERLDVSLDINALS